MAITRGLLTYEAEGMEGGPYHSRKLHVPSASSGLTIGRGYDMKEKQSSKIEGDLIEAKVPEPMAQTLARASGLAGQKAKDFIVGNQLEDFEISMESQEILFNLIYDELSKDVQRICNKPDCVAKYGPVDWTNLHPKIKDVLVDLRFRGDYTPKSRLLIQKIVSDNHLERFTASLTDQEAWRQVPPDRFQRRVDFLNN
ncbi:hypothetical protein SCOR_01375 [Sulfidibacter corallicola]|uniref:Pesticin C-terminal domain-containing protein n=1 Tax=Sulfidibacter corallicola TaxID=2818388 RepID=A0A8A4TI36_SULCO|nr:hypothetical protein [Sulfidibacter corallicola]QTD48822.1 hypothetical protein J3U87_24840 [Sulfidibacter corallicola]